MTFPEAIAVAIVWLVAGGIAVAALLTLAPMGHDVACVWAIVVCLLAAILGTGAVTG